MPTATARSGLVAACDDKRLIGLDLFPRQREILQAVEEHRLAILCLGRRSGKSLMGAAALVWDAALRPHLAQHLLPGERRFSVAIATNQRQARLVLRQAAGLLERSPLLKGLVAQQTEDEISLSTGATIAAFPATSRGGRGWPISLLVMDEAAFFVDSEGNAAAEQVWRALYPSVTQFGADGRVLVASTPFGDAAWFAEMHLRARNGEMDDAVAFQSATSEVNPRIDPALLAAEQARDPDLYRAEYLAEFVGSGGAFLDAEVIRDAAVLDGDLPPSAARDWRAGLDPGWAQDPTGLVIVGRDPVDYRRLVVGCVRAWRPPRYARGATFEERRHHEDSVLREVAGWCRRYDASRIATDQYASAQVVQRLQADGLHVTSNPLTAASKTQVFTELRSRLVTGSLDLPDHPDLLAELRRLRTNYRAGASQVINPHVGGSHGDLAIALAQAVWEHRHVADPDLVPVVGWEGRSIIDELGLPRDDSWRPKASWATDGG